MNNDIQGDFLIMHIAHPIFVFKFLIFGNFKCDIYEYLDFSQYLRSILAAV